MPCSCSVCRQSWHSRCHPVSTPSSVYQCNAPAEAKMRLHQDVGAAPAGSKASIRRRRFKAPLSARGKWASKDTPGFLRMLSRKRRAFSLRTCRAFQLT